MGVRRVSIASEMSIAGWVSQCNEGLERPHVSVQALPKPKLLALENGSSDTAAVQPKVRFSWRIENFVAFKEIMETRKIFSK